MKQRILWADILKWAGMLLIYLGHLPVSENTYLFIFAQHVPLFYFAAGFFAAMTPKEGSFWAFLLKKIRSLLLPYVIFSFLTIIYMLIVRMYTFSDVPRMLLQTLFGIRNQTPAIQLWFLPCLFVISVFFEILKRIIRSRIFIAVIVIALYVVGTFFLGHQPTNDPSWFWNADSAFVYLLFYFLGALLFPFFRDWKYSRKKAGIKTLFWIFFLVSLGYEVFLLFQSVWLSGCLQQTLGPKLFQAANLISTFILLFFFVCFSRFVEKVPGVNRFLAYIGKGSLYLNGHEMIFKNLFSLLFGVLGMKQIVYGSDEMMFLFCFLLMLLLTFTVNLLEKLLFGKLFGDARR